MVWSPGVIVVEKPGNRSLSDPQPDVSYDAYHPAIARGVNDGDWYRKRRKVAGTVRDDNYTMLTIHHLCKRRLNRRNKLPPADGRDNRDDLSTNRDPVAPRLTDLVADQSWKARRTRDLQLVLEHRTQSKPAHSRSLRGS